MSKPTLFLLQSVRAVAVVTKATRGDFGEYFAGVSHEGNTNIVATLRPITLLVQHLDRCIFPLLRQATSPLHSDDDLVEISERVRFFFVGQDLREYGREAIKLAALRFAVAQYASPTLYLSGTLS